MAISHRQFTGNILIPIVTTLLFTLNTAKAGSLERLFAPKAELWTYWNVYSASSEQQIDHTEWEHFLKKYVQAGADGISRVKYASVLAEDKQRLQRYIKTLENVPIRAYSRREQFPYWINLYNAVTINIILKYYPVESIRDINISPGFFSIGPWDKKLLSIENQAVSLNDIEHRILRPIWKDPRLHYALNCASLGCPNLSKSAYVAADIEKNLDIAAQNYINHPRGVKVVSDRLYVSSIYNWFQDDFGQDEAAVIHHLRKYAYPVLSKKLDNIDKISGDNYDWRLNDAAPVKIPLVDDE